MTKTVSGMDDDGRFVTYKSTRHQRKSEQRLIPWSRGPRNGWERFKRAAVG